MSRIQVRSGLERTPLSGSAAAPPSPSQHSQQLGGGRGGGLHTALPLLPAAGSTFPTHPWVQSQDGKDALKRVLGAYRY